MKHLVTVILSIICLAASHAQSYPIQVNTMVSPPYSLQLADYVESGYDRVQVNIMPQDANLTSYKVKLKLVIESFDGKVRIQTSPNYLPNPIFLNGGIPEVLSSYDLYSLFDINNLQFSGYSKNEYLRTKKLPEGYYRIGFEVLDYNRATTGAEVRVSNFGFAMAGLFLNDPPILNMPQNDLKVQVFEPQNLIFQWTPRHKGSPNSAFTAEYVFRLYEVWGWSTDPNVIVNTQNPIYENVLTQNRFVYGISEPLLIPGRQYAWTVQVREIENRGLFRNDGRSEAFLFTYGDECKIPAFFNAKAVPGPGVEADWQGNIGDTDYLLEYRQSGDESALWMEESSMLNNARVYDLSYGTNYQVRVKALCGTFQSDYSEIAEVVTEDAASLEKQKFECGAGAGLAAITNKNPKQSLKSGEIFKAGGFYCQVKEATGSNGKFTGTAYVSFPYYGFALVEHKFENVSINELGEMYAGKLVAIVDSTKAAELQTRIEESVSQAAADKEAAAAAATTLTAEQLQTLLEADEIVKVDKPIEDVSINDAGDVVVTFEDGTEEIIDVEETETVVIDDGQGGQYVVADNQVTPATDAVAVASGAGAANAATVGNVDEAIKNLPIIYFQPAESAAHGYDSLQYDAMVGAYQKAEVREKDYYLPYKAIAAGGTDYVEAKLPEKEGYQPNSVTFKTSVLPVVANPVGEGNNRKLNLAGIAAGDEEEVTAIYSMTDAEGNTHEEELGKFKLVTYDKQIKKVQIVPVNMDLGGGDFENIKASLKATYGQAVIDWDVYQHQRFNIEQDEWDKDGDGIFEADDKDNNMDLTAEMRRIKNAFKKAHDPDKDTWYVFIVPMAHNGGNLTGYGPFKSQWVFIYQNTSNNLGRDVAHELGHAAFNLRHTFSSKNDYQVAQGTTKNLMDYTDGSYLHKYQWDYIHKPDNVAFAFLEDEEEGEGVKHNDPVFVESFLERIRCSYKSGSVIKQESDPWPYWGHSAENITLADGNTYERVSIMVRSDLDNPINTKLPYKKIYTRYSYSFGSIFTIDFNGDNITDFDKYLFPSDTDYKKQLKQSIAEVVKVESEDNLKDLLTVASTCGMEYLTAKQRLKYIELFGNGKIPESEENIILDLLHSTPSIQIDSVISGLKGKSILANLFKRIHDIGGEDNFKRLSSELTLLYYKQDPSKVITNAKKLPEKKIYVWDNSSHKIRMSVVTNTAEIDNNGKVTITKKESDEYESWELFKLEDLDPFETVGVYFAEKIDFIGIEGKVVAMPAIYLAWMVKEYNTQEAITALKTTLNIAAFAVGVYEIVAAVNTIRLVIGVTEVAFTIADLYISESICSGNDVSKADFCEHWTQFSIVANVILLSGNVMADIPALTKGLSKSWDELDEASRRMISQSNPEVPDIISQVKKANATSTGSKMLNSSGEFVDETLEAYYQKYLTRKSKVQKKARERLEWKEVRDYWLNDSPLARGNRFNRKAWDNEWYPYWEVYLENGKYVDGYDPIAKEIISRKATSLEDIDISTFEAYLKEMKIKYSPGTIIKSKKPNYNKLYNKKLEGKQILEIPSSNREFSGIQEYSNLARDKYGIEIRFKDE